MKRDPQDMRRRLYAATDSGRMLAEAFEEQVRDRAARIILYWPSWKQAEVCGLLQRLVLALAKT